MITWHVCNISHISGLLPTRTTRLALEDPIIALAEQLLRKINLEAERPPYLKLEA